MGSSSQAAWNPLESIQNTASHLGDNLNEKEPEFCLHCRWLKPHCVSSFLFLAVATKGISTIQPLMYKHKALSAPLYSNFLSFCWPFLLRRNSRRNTHSWTLYSIHPWQRLMFSVDETGPGFSPRLFFLTMSYTMKTCFLLLLAPTVLFQVSCLWKLQLFWWTFRTEVVPEVIIG